MTHVVYSRLMREAVVAKVARGHRLSSVARDIGLDVGTIRDWCAVAKRHNGSAKVIKGSVAEDVKTLWALGATEREISDELGIRCNTLEHYIYTHRRQFPYRKARKSV